jgi:glycerol-3-phosphate dehydrogenase subunit C
VPGDYNFPRIAANAVRVLEKNGWSVVRPEQTCCGMPNLDGGDIDAARAKARENVASLLARGRAGHAASSSPADVRIHDPQGVARARSAGEATQGRGGTVDVMELLEQQRKDKTLDRDLREGLGKVAYHAACHLRAQKIGYPAARVLGILPDTEVEVVEQCSAVDGTWGMKAQHYEMGKRYAQKLVRGIDHADASAS